MMTIEERRGLLTSRLALLGPRQEGEPAEVERRREGLRERLAELDAERPDPWLPYAESDAL